jgi:glycosyltransferase involved in cell wall biosynthesis
MELTPRPNGSVPKVSVCIPTVDRPDLLREAIASVAAQTRRDFEIVVADNSADIGCQRRVDAVIAEFSRLPIRKIQHPERLDAVSNFNSLIDAARGDLWTCLPDDDRLRPNFLARLVDALDRHSDCDFSFGDHGIIHADGTPDDALSLANSTRYGRTSLAEGVYPHAQLFQMALRQTICLQTAVFRRPMISDVRFAPGVLTLDHSLFLRLGASPVPYQGYFVRERIMDYRLHASQWSSTTRRKDFLLAEIAAFESVPAVPPQHLTEFNEKLSRQYLALALLEAEQSSPDQARAHAIHCFRLSPGLRSAVGAILISMSPRSIPRLRRMAELIRRFRLPAAR